MPLRKQLKHHRIRRVNILARGSEQEKNVILAEFVIVGAEGWPLAVGGFLLVVDTRSVVHSSEMYGVYLLDCYVSKNLGEGSQTVLSWIW